MKNNAIRVVNVEKFDIDRIDKGFRILGALQVLGTIPIDEGDRFLIKNDSYVEGIYYVAQCVKILPGGDIVFSLAV